MSSLQNQVAIVTGGGLGIGGATARRLARGGAKVLIADYGLEAAQANAERIRSAGGTVEVIQTDVSQGSDIQAMVERAVELWGGLNILVNNAWRGKEPDGSAVTLTETGWDYAVSVMVKALFLGAKHAVPYMIEAGSGSIVNISSAHGLMVAPRKLAYETCKAAVIALSRQMATDFGPQGIRVNAICPGNIGTERMLKRWEENPSLLTFFEQQYPLRRTGTPEDIANAVHFLCSEEASFITGQALAVDGGLTIQLQEDLGMHLVRFYRDNPDIDLPG
jgi:NAD(P)-dependent dehydrogenase (short-subunit alcohol dehydrogenase family)